jgi:hypothetical protein
MFLGWWAYKNLYKSFHELGRQRGINNGKTPHYVQSIQL